MKILPVRISQIKNIAKKSPRAALIAFLRGDLVKADQMADRVIARLGDALDGDKSGLDVIDAVWRWTWRWHKESHVCHSDM